MVLVRDFVERLDAPASQLTAWVRPHLQNLATTLLAEIPAAGFPKEQQRVRHQYAHVFQQRLDGALRDIEIGFIGGRAIMTDSQKSQSKAFRLLQGIYDRTNGGGGPVFVAELAEAAGLSEPELQAAWRYLKQMGLIETFNLPYTARINAKGIHAIEDAQRHPDQPPQGFPSVTYNIVNNTTTIGTAINSPVQQAGPSSTQTQVITYSAQERADLARLVNEFANHLHELQLDATASHKAKAQLATLRAQLSDEPDPIIVQQAGRTLRNITEAAIGGLIATALQPTVWSWVADTMARLFS